MGIDERGVLKRHLAAGTVLAVVLSTLGTHACYQQITEPHAGEDGGQDGGDAGFDAGNGSLAWSEITPSGASADTFCGISGSPDGSVVYVLANDGMLFARRDGGWIQVANRLWDAGADRCGIYAGADGLVLAAGDTKLLSCQVNCDLPDASYRALNTPQTVLAVCGHSDSAFATTLQSGSGYRYDAGSWELTSVWGGLYRGCWMTPDGDAFIGSKNAMVTFFADGGSTFTPMVDAPIPEHTYEEVWGVGEEIFAAGGHKTPTAGGEQAVIHRRPGSGWEFVYRDAGTFLYAISGTGIADIYAGGAYDLDAGNVLLHYDGLQWKRVSTPQMPTMDIIELWGVTPTDYYAIGRCRTDGGPRACVVKSKPQ